MRDSQLRGSGGISPRFPNIPLRDKGEVGQRASGRPPQERVNFQ
jgi:hypothetical protein